MNHSPRVVVIGAGASGLVAAGTAASNGAEVLLLEKKPRAGLKLRITGQGRCNLTNTADLEEFLTHFGRQGKFLRQAFNTFFSHDLVAFLGELGIETTVETHGRVFLADNNANLLTEHLTDWARHSGARILPNHPVDTLLLADNGITGVKAAGQDYPADTVIIATGGASYPGTGSTGDGYRLAEQAGHTIVPIRPALVPLTVAGDLPQRLQGLSLTDIAVSAVIDSRRKTQVRGELLFTHFGLSGPSVLQLSGEIVDALREGKAVAISIDLRPDTAASEIDRWLQTQLRDSGKRRIGSLLKDLLPVRLADLCRERLGIAPDRTGSQITATERRSLGVWLKDFRLDISGHRPLAEATVTAGGIETKEIDPRTMQSRLIQGLYFCGEVIDIDADTGGFNLQAAFSTGRLAGLWASLR